MIRLLLALVLSAVEAQELTPDEKKKLMDQHYSKAFGYYSNKEYGRAIEHYTNVLKLDPDQQTAKKLLEDARGKLAEANRQRQGRFKDNVEAGDYKKAYELLQALLDDDPNSARYLTMQQRLEKISPIVPRAPSRAKAWVAARKGLSAFIGVDGSPDPKLAYNALRYAAELDPKAVEMPKLIALVENAYPDLADADRLPEGTSFIEYKRQASLSLIYDGKYAQAMKACDEILAFAPDDVPTLKRYGSAYYQLGKRRSARKVWQKALTLAPDDKQLQKYLGKTANAPEDKE